LSDASLADIVYGGGGGGGEGGREGGREGGSCVMWLVEQLFGQAGFTYLAKLCKNLACRELPRVANTLTFM
jgi:hypothetical protein